jgi:hypothetical protein
MTTVHEADILLNVDTSRALALRAARDLGCMRTLRTAWYSLAGLKCAVFVLGTPCAAATGSGSAGPCTVTPVGTPILTSKSAITAKGVSERTSNKISCTEMASRTAAGIPMMSSQASALHSLELD